MPDLLDRLKTALADRYAIEREIGAGGMATVYLAEDLKLHRKVAVKLLRPAVADLAVRVRAPTVGRTARRQAAGVVSTGVKRLERQSAGDIGRHPAVARRTAADA